MWIWKLNGQLNFVLCLDVQVHGSTGRYNKSGALRAVPVTASSDLFRRLLSCYGNVFPYILALITLNFSMNISSSKRTQILLNAIDLLQKSGLYLCLICIITLLYMEKPEK
jgi:hypothetical protein